MLSFRSVSKIYPGSVIGLNDVDLEIGKGEFVFVVGPSGAGKSTLLKLVYREEVPTSGAVLVNGWDVARLRRSRIPFLRRHIGVVFQDVRLLSQRSVFDNVAFTLRVTEEVHRDLKKRVMEALDMVAVADLWDKMPRQLSGGEQQRVGIARAMVGRPILLLGDEPTGNLDPQTSEDILRTFIDINRGGTTVVMATHDASLVDTFRQRVVAFEAGRIVRDELAGSYADSLLSARVRS